MARFFDKPNNKTIFHLTFNNSTYYNKSLIVFEKYRLSPRAIKRRINNKHAIPIDHFCWITPERTSTCQRDLCLSTTTRKMHSQKSPPQNAHKSPQLLRPKTNFEQQRPLDVPLLALSPNDSLARESSQVFESFPIERSFLSMQLVVNQKKKKEKWENDEEADEEEQEQRSTNGARALT